MSEDGENVVTEAVHVDAAPADVAQSDSDSESAGDPWPTLGAGPVIQPSAPSRVGWASAVTSGAQVTPPEKPKPRRKAAPSATQAAAAAKGGPAARGRDGKAPAKDKPKPDRPRRPPSDSTTGPGGHPRTRVESCESPEACSALLSNAARLVKDLQTRHGVHVSVKSADDDTTWISGPPEAVEPCLEEMKGLKFSIKKIPFQLDDLGRIVGKSMSRLKEIQAAVGSCDVKVDREESMFRIMGVADAVRDASAMLRSLVEDQATTEEVLTFRSPTVVSAAFKQGSVKALMKEHGTLIRLSVPTRTGVSSPATVTISGARKQVDQALRAVKDRVRAAENTCVELSAQGGKRALAALLGKGGSTLSKIRQEFPLAEVDVLFDVSEVRVYCGEDGVSDRDGAVAACKAVLEANLADSINLHHREVCAEMLSKKPDSVEVRKKVEELSCTLETDLENTCCRVHGAADNLEAAKKVVEAWVEARGGYLELNITEEDSSRLMSNGRPMLLKLMQETAKADYGVTLSLRSGILIIRGGLKNVKQAAKRVQNILDGEDEAVFTAIARVRPETIPAVVGKSGSKISQLEKEHGVVCEANRDTGTVRVYGPKAGAERAKILIEKEAMSVSISVTLTPPAGVEGGAGSIVSKAEVRDAFADIGVRTRRGPNGQVSIIGPSQAISAAQAAFNEACTGRAVAKVALGSSKRTGLLTQKGNRSTVEGIARQTKAEIVVDETLNCITVSGAADNVQKALDQVWKLLEVYFSGNMASVPCPTRSCLRALNTSGQLLECKDGDAEVTADVRCCAVRVTSTSGSASSSASKVQAKIDEWLAEHPPVRVPGFNLAQIVGKGGKGLKALLSGRNDKISLDIQRGLNENDDALIVVMGGEGVEPEEVVAVRQALEERVAALPSNRTVIEIPQDKVARIIGRQGKNIKELQSTHGVSVDINSGKARAMLYISGEADATAAAKAAVEEMLKDGPDANVCTLDLPRWAPLIIIGRSGTTVRQLQRETGARISVDADNCQLSITGPPECVAVAQERLTAWLQNGGNDPLVESATPAAEAAASEEVAPDGEEEA